MKMRKMKLGRLSGNAAMSVLFAVALTVPQCGSGARAVRAARQSAVERAVDSLIGVRTFHEVAVSPDGSKVAWSESLLGRDKAPTGNYAVYVADWRSPSAAPKRLTAGAGTNNYAEHDIAWSPDSTRIAFLSDRDKPGQLELYVADAAGGRARKLTDLKGYLSTPGWSPDGRRLALLFTENASRVAGPTQPTAPDAGVIEEHVDEQPLTIVDPVSGAARQVSPSDMYVYEYDWSPDSRSFAMTAAHGSGDNNWFVAQLYTMSAETGDMKSLLNPSMQIAEPHWSPDGRQVAFVGGLMSDEGVTGGDIYTVAAGGGEARNLTPGMKASASQIAWMASSDQIVFAEHVDGGAGVAALDLSDKSVKTLWTGAETISKTNGVGLSLSRDGRTSAVVRHSFERPPEAWAGPVGEWRQLTDVNAALRPAWGQVKSVHWTSDGRTVQGWLVYPHDFDPSRKHPMVVVRHGGPSSQIAPRWGSR